MPSERCLPDAAFATRNAGLYARAVPNDASREPEISFVRDLLARGFRRDCRRIAVRSSPPSAPSLRYPAKKHRLAPPFFLGVDITRYSRDLVDVTIRRESLHLTILQKRRDHNFQQVVLSEQRGVFAARESMQEQVPRVETQ